MNEKCSILVERIAEKGTIVIRRLSNDENEQDRFYSLFNSNKFNREKIIKEYGKEYQDNALEGKEVLAIQDTTEINYSSHKGRVKQNSGIGAVRNGTGFFLHPVITIIPGEEDKIAIPYVYHWARENSAEIRKKNKENRKKIPIDQKESYRWIYAPQKAKGVLEKAKQITFISDRESDIYEEFCLIPDEKTNLIVRSRDNRSILEGNGKLFDYLSQQELSGSYTIEVIETIKNKSVKRQATVEVRYASVTIKRPRKFNKDCPYPEFKQLNAIEVKEIKETIPEGSKGIHWRLLTTHKVESFSDAVRIVEFYKYRWYIEQFFRILKKRGFDVESSEFESGEALKNLVLLALPSAIKVMMLMLARDGSTQKNTTFLFDEEELECLIELNKKYEGKLKTHKNPYPKKTLGWISWIMARMGGWKGKRSERPPGPITFYRGLEDFERIMIGWRLSSLLKHRTR